MKQKTILVIVFLVLFVGLSFLPIQRESKTLEETIGNPKVHEVLKRACFDCHSYQTNWPWYSYLFPTNLLISHHVQEGRAELNFHEWHALPISKQSIKIDSILEEVESGEMPLKSYLFLHKEAQITADDLEILRAWQKEIETEILDMEVEDDE
ncbi:MAG: heme-binding domain-containing protein [Leptospiraceae bacterium]|nr:heme-binding domain-containing protein [Leptospiraceae bacterium]